MVKWFVTMHRCIENIFHDCFRLSHKTALVGGQDEPFYQADSDGEGATIFYRSNYASSALHEVAHWCIAGAERRRIDDYGYWYEPDGRSADQQAQFEQVEVKPQALEWLFSKAVGVPFRLSVDNLSNEFVASSTFGARVRKQAIEYCQGALPERASVFLKALQCSGRIVSVSDLKL